MTAHDEEKTKKKPEFRFKRVQAWTARCAHCDEVTLHAAEALAQNYAATRHKCMCPCGGTLPTEVCAGMRKKERACLPGGVG